MAIVQGQSPVNQNAVAVEDLSALTPKSGQPGENEPEMAESLLSDTAPVEPKVATPDETAADPLSKQYAILAKREKQLRLKMQQQEQALKAREEAFAAREAALTAKDQEYSSGYISKDTLKSNTLQALIEAGLDPQDAIQRIYEQNSNPVDPRLQAKLDAMEAKLKAYDAAQEAREKQAAEQQDQGYKQAIAKLTSDTKKLVFTGNDFEMIKNTNSVADVVQLIEETFKRDRVELSVTEAAQMVEDYLVDEALKLSKTEKIQKRLASQVAPAAAPAQKTPASPQQPQAQMKTLTNATSSTKKLSVRERAIAAANGQKF